MSDTELLPKSKPEPVRRLEVFTGSGRRRTWTSAQKAEILAESYESGEKVSAVARRHGPHPASTGAGKHLQPTHRLRLGFGQKLSVRHVSNPLDSTGSTFADLRSALKVRSKGRLQTTEHGHAGGGVPVPRPSSGVPRRELSGPRCPFLARPTWRAVTCALKATSEPLSDRLLMTVSVLHHALDPALIVSFARPKTVADHPFALRSTCKLR